MSQSDNDELNNYLDNLWGTNPTLAETTNSYETLSSSENASQTSLSHQTEVNTTYESTASETYGNSGYFANSQASEASQDPDTTIEASSVSHDSETINTWSYNSVIEENFSQTSSFPRSSTTNSFGYNYESSFYTDDATQW